MGMKRAIVGGFLALVGSLWTLAVVILAGSLQISGWTTPPGRAMTQVLESGLMPWFVGSLLLTVLGIVLMAAAYFSKDQ